MAPFDDPRTDAVGQLFPVATPVKEMPPSPALQIIGKMKYTLMGRAVGILITDGSDGAVIAFIIAAKTRQWEREKTLRTLA